MDGWMVRQNAGTDVEAVVRVRVWMVGLGARTAEYREHAERRVASPSSPPSGDAVEKEAGFACLRVLSSAFVLASVVSLFATKFLYLISRLNEKHATPRSIDRSIHVHVRKAPLHHLQYSRPLLLTFRLGWQ